MLNILYSLKDNIGRPANFIDLLLFTENAAVLMTK